MEKFTYIFNSILKQFNIKLVRHHNPFKDFIRIVGNNNSPLHCLDGGAFKGNVSDQILQLSPLTKVYAFEPQFDLYEKLNKRFEGQERIEIFNLAISDKQGSAIFHINEQAYTSSLLDTKESDIMKPRKEQAVNLTTIDEWSKAYGVTIDFLKLDLQGHDFKGLIGANNSLENIKAVLVEAGFKSRYENENLFPEILTYLYQKGFQLYRMYDIHGDENGAWKHGDALLIKSDLFD